MSKHTQGKLTADEDGLLADEKGRCVAAIGSWGDMPGPEKMIADTQRLAACWNACAGFDTELLENIDMMGDTLKQRFECMQAEVQRMDAMLGRRPCQNERCDKLSAALALLGEANAANSDLLCQLGAMRAALTDVLCTHDTARSYFCDGIFVDEFADHIRDLLK